MSSMFSTIFVSSISSCTSPAACLNGVTHNPQRLRQLPRQGPRREDPAPPRQRRHERARLPPAGPAGLRRRRLRGRKANFGLGQEIFLVDREECFRRPELQFTGRTIMGKLPAHATSSHSCRRSPSPASTAVGEQLVPLQRGHPMSYAVSAALMPSNTAGLPGAR